jgi:hypothetical protein
LEYSTIDGITAQKPSKEVQSGLGQLCMLAREMKNFEQVDCYTVEHNSGSFIEATMTWFSRLACNSALAVNAHGRTGGYI